MFPSNHAANQNLDHTIGVLSLLLEIAHGWPTMLTVILQASELKALVVGEEYLTVIAFDMALYEKAVQLLPNHADCDSASIRIEDVGRWWRIPDSDCIRHGTVREGSAVTGFTNLSERSSCPQTGWATCCDGCAESSGNVHRKLRNRWCVDWGWRIWFCHNQTDPQVRPLQGNSSYTHPHLYGSIWTCSGTVLNREAKPKSHWRRTSRKVPGSLCKISSWQKLKSRKRDKDQWRSTTNPHERRRNTAAENVGSAEILKCNVQVFDELHPPGWNHLALCWGIQEFLIKYKHLWPRYIADMHELNTSHPETWRELQDGNISVTKSTIP